MKKINNLVLMVLLLFRKFVPACMVMFLISCDIDLHKPDTTPPEMILPVSDPNDFLYISRIYSSTLNSPIQAIHRGLDFAPAGDMKTFHSVFDGEVTRIDLFENTGSGAWQVNVHIKHNDAYAAEYAFEPFTTNQTDGQIQLDNITVQDGQSIAAGQIIGRLYAPNSNSHLHFSFFKDDEMTCPENYWTEEARTILMDMIHAANPDWEMCY